jgi:DNA ligase 1
MLMPMLYKRTTAGAIQTWWMEIEDDKYRTHSGQDGGQIVTSAWTVCEGKNAGRANATSAEEQALREVESAYKLKRKRGYTDDIDAARDAVRFACMLALPYDDYVNKIPNDEPLWVQPKLDGIRCIATAAGLRSRDGNPIVAVPHIEEQLAPFFAQHPTAILDGELYNHDMRHDFNQIVSLVKKQKPTAEHLASTKASVEYWVFDGLLSLTDTRCWSERFFHSIGPELEALPDAPAVVVVPSSIVTGSYGLDAAYEHYLSDEFEGVMVRYDVAYQMGKRTKYLLKRKEFADEEYTILDIREGVGNGAGLAKIAEMQMADGRTFKADIVGNRTELQEMLRRRDEVIGKQATVVRFKQLTPDGKPRFPKLKVVHFTSRW